MKRVTVINKCKSWRESFRNVSCFVLMHPRQKHRDKECRIASRCFITQFYYSKWGECRSLIGPTTVKDVGQARLSWTRIVLSNHLADRFSRRNLYLERYYKYWRMKIRKGLIFWKKSSLSEERYKICYKPLQSKNDGYKENAGFEIALELHFEVLREGEREISWKCITRNGSIFQSTAVSRHEFKRVLLDVQLPVGETHRCTRAQ